MALEKIRIKALFSLNQQNAIYNNLLTMEALVIGYKEFCEQQGLGQVSQLFLDNFMKSITYKTLKDKIKEIKK